MSIEYDCHNWDVDGFPGEYVYGDCGYVDDYHMDERWKPVYDIPGYWVSNKGRVWSTISEMFIEGTALKNGHIDMTLRYNGIRVHRYLHRLVAEAFIPNPNNYPLVRHMDDNPYNNEVCNLAWGTQYDNVQDCIHNKHFRYFTREDIERANAVRRTPVIAIDLKSGKRLFFDSQQDAARHLGMSQSSIYSVIRGKTRSCNGYYFALQSEFDDAFDHTSYLYRRNRMPIRAININTNDVRVYDSARQAAFDLGISEAGISLVLNSKSSHMRGWTFKYVDTGDECYE